MKLSVFQVDAFTDKLFGGNPACVVPLAEWLPNDTMIKIARENAVAETAFFIEKDNQLHLRWFTPEFEMDLCGHATLATAHVLKKHLQYKSDSMSFESASGRLVVSVADNLYTLNFPSRNPIRAELPLSIRDAFAKPPLEVWKARDYVLVYEKEDDVKNISINRQIVDRINIDPGGIVVTAPGDFVDFVSRFFTPQATVFEDPVTGSAHCSLIPYWSKRLNKKEMTALQLSARVGKLQCVDANDRVLISGNAVTYLEGSITIR